MITDKEIYTLLEPHLISIRQIHEESLVKINEVMNMLDVIMYKRSKATGFNNIVLEKAKVYFKGIEGIEVIEKYETLVLSFKEGLLSRFKKVSKQTLLSCHANNNRNKELIQGTLFAEYPPSVFVEIGYVVNALFSSFEKISVIKRIDKVGIELFEILPLVELKPETFKATEIDIETNKEEDQIKIKKT